MISLDKKYKTRHGRDVRILCVDGPSASYPIVGFISGDYNPHVWHRDGVFMVGEKSEKDLIEVPKTINVYGKIIAYTTVGKSWISSEVFTLETNTGILKSPRGEIFHERLESLRKIWDIVVTADIDMQIDHT